MGDVVRPVKPLNVYPAKQAHQLTLDIGAEYTT
jgi:hypothetical protein